MKRDHLTGERDIDSQAKLAGATRKVESTDKESLPQAQNRSRSLYRSILSSSRDAPPAFRLLLQWS